MGRPVSLSDSVSTTWVQNVQYDLAGRMNGMQYFAGPYSTNNVLVPIYTQETMSYNVNGQLASLNWGNASSANGSYTAQYSNIGPSGGIQYSYSATQKTGRSLAWWTRFRGDDQLSVRFAEAADVGQFDANSGSGRRRGHRLMDTMVLGI